MICATLVNTQTDSFWPAILLAQPAKLRTVTSQYLRCSSSVRKPTSDFAVMPLSSINNSNNHTCETYDSIHSQDNVSLQGSSVQQLNTWYMHCNNDAITIIQFYPITTITMYLSNNGSVVKNKCLSPKTYSHQEPTCLAVAVWTAKTFQSNLTSAHQTAMCTYWQEVDNNYQNVIWMCLVWHSTMLVITDNIYILT